MRPSVNGASDTAIFQLPIIADRSVDDAAGVRLLRRLSRTSVDDKLSHIVPSGSGTVVRDRVQC